VKHQNPRHFEFIDNLLSGMGPQAAYENVKGYRATGPGAAAAASKLLKSPKIQQMLTERRRKAAEKAEATAERIIREECCLAYADVRKAFSQGVEIPPEELPDEIARAISRVDVKERLIEGSDGQQVIERNYRYFFWDKGRALERISKIVGVYEEDNKQKSDHTRILDAILGIFPVEYADSVRKALEKQIGVKNDS
jgi:hypothetical protein